jgi:hypothetical protein
MFSIKSFRDFVKTTIASYKTTSDLIEAMKNVESMVPLYTADNTKTERIDAYKHEDHTMPDHRHD